MKYLLLALMAFFVTPVLADARVDVPVSKSVLKPHDSADLITSALNDGIYYDLSCTLDSSADDVYFFFKMISGGWYGIMLNDKPTSYQMLLKKGDNTVSITVEDARIALQNLDNDGIITVKECHAKPAIPEVPTDN